MILDQENQISLRMRQLRACKDPATATGITTCAEFSRAAARPVRCCSKCEDQASGSQNFFFVSFFFLQLMVVAAGVDGYISLTLNRTLLPSLPTSDMQSFCKLCVFFLADVEFLNFSFLLAI